MLIAPYWRRSKRDKKRGISIGLQHDESERWASEQRFPVVFYEPYIDDGTSAFTDDLSKRPAFKRLLDDARARKFDAILVYMYDRFARKLDIAAPVFAEFDKLKIQVFSICEPEDWEARAQASLDAEKFSRRLGVRMKGVKYRDARQGRWVGAVPFGYDRVEGYLVPNADAEIVRLIFTLYATNGYSIMDIVDDLKARGFMRTSICHYDGAAYPIGAQSIRQILTNRVYLGESRCGTIAIPGAHPYIVDDQLWQSTQDIRSRRATHRGRLTIQAPDRGILAGTARCSCCGAACWYSKSGKGQRAYNCKTKVRLHGCANPPAHVDDADRLMIHWLKRCILPSDWQQQALATIAQQTTVTPPDRVIIERELRRLKEAFLDERITAAEYEQMKLQLHAQNTPPSIAIPDLDRAAALLANLPQVFNDATPDELRALVSTLFSAVWLQSSVVVAWTPRETYMPLFGALYKTGGGRCSLTLFPSLWSSDRVPIAA
jgi:site-specific DNA recombinase